MNGPCLEHVRQQAAAKRLQSAATFAELNMKHPLFQQRMVICGKPILVRFAWPGILQVLDPKTGSVLAESEPGNHHSLKLGFVPPPP